VGSSSESTVAEYVLAGPEQVTEFLRQMVEGAYEKL